MHPFSYFEIIICTEIFELCVEIEGKNLFKATASNRKWNDIYFRFHYFTKVMHVVGLSITKAMPLAHEITDMARWP